MSAIPATFIDGMIIPDVPPDWPNGARLVVETVSVPPVRMMTEDDQGDDPESIARWIAWADSLQPLVSNCTVVTTDSALADVPALRTEN